MTHHPRFAWLVLALALLGGALRLGVAELVFPARPLGDEIYYLGTALHIADGTGHVFNPPERAFRPPAFPALLSLFLDPGKHPETQRFFRFMHSFRRLDLEHPTEAQWAVLRALVAVQIALGTLLVVLTAWLGRALFDARTGLLAALFAAVHPTLIAFSHYLLSETLFSALVCAAFVAVVACARRESRSLAALAGVLFGLAALTRSLGIPVAIACATWLVWSAEARRRGGAALCAGLLLASAALAIAPWTARNHAVLGRLVPVATVGWFSAAEGNSLSDEDWLDAFPERRTRFKERYFELQDELARLDFARSYTLSRIREEQPLWLPKKIVRNLGLLLEPDSDIFDRIRRGAYREPSAAMVLTLIVAQGAFYVFVLTTTVVGVAAARADGRRSFAVLVAGAVCAVHVLANATARFRVPWLPLALVYGTHALFAWRSLLHPGSRRTLAAAAAVLLLAVALTLPHLPGALLTSWRPVAPASEIP